MDYSFLFIEGLPEGYTLTEITEVVKQHIPCEALYTMRYITSYGVVDFRCAIAKLKTSISYGSTEKYKNDQFKIKGYKIQINFLNDIQSFKTSFIFFNATKDEVSNAIGTSIDKKNIISFTEVATHVIPMTILQGIGREKIIESLKQANLSIEWMPIIHTDPTVSIKSSELKNLIPFEPLHDSFVVFRGKKYGISKPIAEKLSVSISKLEKGGELTLPDMEKLDVCPIDAIIDFLWGRNIKIQFEELPFMKICAETLQSDQLLELINKYIASELDPLSSVALIMSYNFAGIKDIPFKWALDNLDNIIKFPECLADLPEELCFDFIQSADDESIDVKAKLVDALPLSNETKIDILKSFDKNGANKAFQIFKKYNV